MKITVTNNPSSRKPVEQWSNKTILLYFSNRLFDKYKSELKIPAPAWGAFVGRIKGFRERLGLTSFQYKQFIDDIFDSGMFKSKKFRPSFGCIVSIRMFKMIQEYKESKGDLDPEYWERMVDHMYHNNLLFQKIAEEMDNA